MQKSGFPKYVIMLGFGKFGHICGVINQLCGWSIILYFLTHLFYPLHFNIYLLGFQVQNSVWIIEGSDYGGSDNRGPPVLTYLMIIEIPYSGKDWWEDSLVNRL